MASKVTASTKAEFQNRIKDYKKTVEELKNKSKDFELTIKATQEPGEIALTKIKIAEISIALVSWYCGMSDLSSHMLKFKNETYLNDGRKMVYKALQVLEETLGKIVDDALNHNEEVHEHLSGKVDDIWKYNFVKVFGFTIETLKAMYGENSKWKWSFVELEGRFAVCVKNFINFKELIKGLDPRAEGYKERTQLLKLIKKLLKESAKNFRQKYELTEQRLDDMKYAINLMGISKRIHLYLGEEEDATESKKVYDLWRKKLEDDMKKKDKNS